MPIAVNPAAHNASTAEVDASTLLPTRAELIEHLDERAAVADEQTATLVLVGLLRRDDGWPTPASTLATITGFFARSIRGEDHLARSGPTEFALVFTGPVNAAEAAATRLVAAVSAAGVPGLSAAAGIAGLAPGVSGGEVHRRATLCLAAARSVGGGQVITYSGTR